MDCGSNYESSILSGHPICRGGPVSGKRQSLKLASGVRFAHSLPLAAGAIGGAPRSERGGSRFEAWAASQFIRGYRSKDRTERYERSDWGSTPHTRTRFCGRSSNRTGRSAPNAEIGVGIPTGRPVFRGGGRAARRLIVDQDQMGSTPIHRATGVSSNRPGSLSFKQRMRDRDPPPLPSFGL